MIDFNPIISPELNDVMNYAEYLEANGLTLDENGREVPKEKSLSLTLKYGYDEEDNE